MLQSLVCEHGLLRYDVTQDLDDCGKSARVNIASSDVTSA